MTKLVSFLNWLVQCLSNSLRISCSDSDAFLLLVIQTEKNNKGLNSFNMKILRLARLIG